MLAEDGQQVEMIVTDPLDLQVVDRWQGRSCAVRHLAGRSDAAHKERVERLKWMKLKAKQLEEKEHALHLSLGPKVAEVLRPQKLILLEP